MKTREEIMKAAGGFFTQNPSELQLEVLLDIRELLETLVQLQRLKGP